MMADNNPSVHLKKIWNGLFLTLLLVMFSGMPAFADIYIYVDKNGVKRFTNTPSSPNYRLYMKGNTGSTVISTTKKKYSGRSDQFDGLIDKASRDYGVSPRLLKSIIKVESNFNPEAVSKKGAKGLMQIMPQNFSFLDIDDPADPYQNIMGGTRYLKQMLEKYNNDLHLALAAYNAGPAAVDKYNDIPPYRETKDYVRKVKHYFENYAY
jgi:soluble lytic murein transglycosylase